MRRITVALIIGILSLCALFAEETKPRAGAFDLSGSGVTKFEASVASDLFRRELSRTGAFDGLDRDSVDMLLAEQEALTTMNAAAAVRIGKKLGFDYVFFGSLINVGSTYFIEMEMISVLTGKAEKSQRMEIDRVNRLDNAVSVLAVFFADADDVAPKSVFPLYYENVSIGLLWSGHFLDDASYFRDYGAPYNAAFGAESFAQGRLFGFDSDAFRWTWRAGLTLDFALGRHSASVNYPLVEDNFYFVITPYVMPLTGGTVRLGVAEITLGMTFGVPFFIESGVIGGTRHTTFLTMFELGGTLSARFSFLPWGGPYVSVHYGRGMMPKAKPKTLNLRTALNTVNVSFGISF